MDISEAGSWGSPFWFSRPERRQREPRLGWVGKGRREAVRCVLESSNLRVGCLWMNFLPSLALSFHISESEIGLRV